MRIPLPNGQFAYLCWLSGVGDWLYDFVPDKPLRSARYFSHNAWKYLIAAGRLTEDVENVCQMPGIWQCFDPRKYYRLAPARDLEKDPARAYVIPDPSDPKRRFGGVDLLVTKEQIEGYVQLHVDAAYGKTASWIMDRLSDFRQIEVPAEDEDRRKPKILRPVNEPRIFEIEVPFTGETPFPQRDALEAALDNALTEGDVGEVMGAGSGPGETFDLAAEIDARKRKTGLRLIRKALKSCKVPPTTKIYEIDPSTLERVELPLSDS